MTKGHMRGFNKKKNITFTYILKNLICGEVGNGASAQHTKEALHL